MDGAEEGEEIQMTKPKICKGYRSGEVCRKTVKATKTPKLERVRYCAKCKWFIDASSERIELARSALSTILQWSKDKSGMSLYPEYVEKLCKKALKVTK